MFVEPAAGEVSPQPQDPRSTRTFSTATNSRNDIAATVATVDPMWLKLCTSASVAAPAAVARTRASTSTTVEWPMAKKKPTPTLRRPRCSISRVVSSIAAM